MVFFASIAFAIGANAQEERFLPFHVQVESAGLRATEFTVTIYNDNQQVAKLEPSKRNTCELMLEIGTYYSIRISKPGSRDKLLAVDTHLPDGVGRYGPYPCLLELEPVDPTNGDPFYGDFPCAVIRWDDGSQRFDHSDHYLQAIRAKIGATDRTAAK